MGHLTDDDLERAKGNREQLVDRLRHLVPAMSLSADSNGGQAATIGWESSEPVAPLVAAPVSTHRV